MPFSNDLTEELTLLDVFIAIVMTARLMKTTNFSFTKGHHTTKYLLYIF